MATVCSNNSLEINAFAYRKAVDRNINPCYSYQIEQDYRKLIGMMISKN